MSYEELTAAEIDLIEAQQKLIDDMIAKDRAFRIAQAFKPHILELL